MRGKLLERCAFALCAVALVAAPTATARSWSEPGAVANGLEPSVALDASGAGFVGYIDYNKIIVRERSAAGELGPPTTIGQPLVRGTMYDLDVEVAADGSAAAAWYEQVGGDPHLMATTRPAGGSFGPPQLVATEVHGRDVFGLAVAPGGWAMLVWDHGPAWPEYVVSSIAKPGLPFAPPKTVSHQTAPIDITSVAIDGQGTAIAVWDEYATGTPMFAVRPADGPWGAQGELRPGNMGSSWPSVAFDGAGNALTAMMSGGAIDTRYRPAGGSFAPAENAAPSGVAGEAAGEYFWPSPIGFDAAGDATILWRKVDGMRLFASTRAAAGGFGAPQELSTGTSDRAKLAVAGSGAAFALWLRAQEGTSFSPPPATDLNVAVRPGAAEPFGAQQTLVPDASDADVAADAAGNAVVVWSVRWGNPQYCGQIRMATYSDAAPSLPAAGKPSCAAQDHPVPSPHFEPRPPDPAPEQPADPAPQPAADTHPPTLSVSGARRQPLARRRLMVGVRCSEDCAATVRGVVKLGKRRIAPRAVTKRLRSGRRGTLVLKLSAADAKRLRAAVAQRRRTLALTVTATDAAGNRTTRRRSIKLVH